VACVPDGLLASNAMRYASEVQFASDITNHVFNFSVYKYVVYDPESGNGTPLAEAQQPEQYMKAFNTLAVANGLIPVVTPARDLGNTDLFCPKLTGEGLDAWSIRCNIWGRAAAGSGGKANVVVQTQADTTNLTAFDSLYNSASAEILAWFANTKAKPWGEISTTYGTAAQEEAAAESIPGTTGLDYSFTSTGVPEATTVLAALESMNW
jgi:hypothetical protein